MLIRRQNITLLTLLMKQDIHVFSNIAEVEMIHWYLDHQTVDLPLPNKKNGNDMANLGPYMAHMWK